MTPDAITISGGRYWAAKLHGDHHPRKLGSLLKCDHGTYTATVDGKTGVLTIAADGWWFSEAQEKPRGAEPKAATPLAQIDALVIAQLKASLNEAHGLLTQWLELDNWENEDIAPRRLVARTRKALSLSPAKATCPRTTGDTHAATD